MYVISRFQHGISLNPREFILDDDGNVRKFESRETAVKFLLEAGVPEDSIDESIFIDEEQDVL
jgi:hypothetical protein